MENEAIQDRWPELAGHCWGCGRSNAGGLRIKSRWVGDECVCEWRPEPHHLAFPGFLNGGIIATLIDCHSINTASSAAYINEGREIGTEPPLAYMTGSLFVKYLRPTPVDRPVTLRARVVESGERRAVVVCKLLSDGRECAAGEVVAVRIKM